MRRYEFMGLPVLVYDDEAAEFFSPGWCHAAWRQAPTCLLQRDHDGPHFDPGIGNWNEGDFHRPYVPSAKETP